MKNMSFILRKELNGLFGQPSTYTLYIIFITLKKLFRAAKVIF